VAAAAVCGWRTCCKPARFGRGDRAVAVDEFLHDGPAAGVGEGLDGGGEFLLDQAIAACL
jgi:hypothetical protein